MAAPAPNRHHRLQQNTTASRQRFGHDGSGAGVMATQATTVGHPWQCTSSPDRETATGATAGIAFTSRLEPVRVEVSRARASSLRREGRASPVAASEPRTAEATEAFGFAGRSAADRSEASRGRRPRRQQTAAVSSTATSTPRFGDPHAPEASIKARIPAFVQYLHGSTGRTAPAPTDHARGRPVTRGRDRGFAKAPCHHRSRSRCGAGCHAAVSVISLSSSRGRERGVVHGSALAERGGSDRSRAPVPRIRNAGRSCLRCSIPGSGAERGRDPIRRSAQFRNGRIRSFERPGTVDGRRIGSHP
jgi:hypothetical protein